MALSLADVPTEGCDMWTVGRWTRVAVLLLAAVASAYGEWHDVLANPLGPSGYFTLPVLLPSVNTIIGTLQVAVP